MGVQLWGWQGCPLDFVLHLVVTLAPFPVVSLRCANSTCLSWLPLFLPTRKSVPALGLKLFAAERTDGGGECVQNPAGRKKQTFYFSTAVLEHLFVLIKATVCNVTQSKWGF